MPYYAATGSAIATALNSQFFAIRAPAGNPCRIAELRLFTNAATATRVALSRTSPISTSGSAVTVAKLNAADRAATSSVVTVATAGTLTAGDIWSWGAAAAGAGFIWVPPDDLVIPASGEIVLRALVAGSAVDVGAIFEE